jgi:hypothetical protein
LGVKSEELGLLFTLIRPEGWSARIAIGTPPDQLKRQLSGLVAIAVRNKWDIPDPDGATVQLLRQEAKHWDVLPY